jgi:hypothetical protein
METRIAASGFRAVTAFQPSSAESTPPNISYEQVLAHQRRLEREAAKALSLSRAEISSLLALEATYGEYAARRSLLARQTIKSGTVDTFLAKIALSIPIPVVSK